MFLFRISLCSPGCIALMEFVGTCCFHGLLVHAARMVESYTAWDSHKYSCHSNHSCSSNSHLLQNDGETWDGWVNTACLLNDKVKHKKITLRIFKCQ